mmetsp:Transcript_23890/g.58390  ORF Transcript_23890/g.58390 Transcript_23890/m.58390 type:complete len:166 (-) Transcript_23890:129-626(-)
MYGCGIEAQPMEAFVRKLDRIKHLKVLAVGDNPFQASPSCVAALKDALWRNHSLEIAHLGGNPPNIIASRLEPVQNPFFSGSRRSQGTPLTNREMLPLHLNRAGRGPLQRQLTQSAMVKLIPLILERAGGLQYCVHCDISADQTMEDRRRKEVVFWLLRNLILIA